MKASSHHGVAPLGAAGLAGLLALSGCISLLPKEKPAQLYRFGAEASAVAAPPASGSRFTVRAAPISFERAAASDRILTTDGDQTAYIAGARWITSADSLFAAAITRAFDLQGGEARLLAPGEPGAGDYMLKVDVRSFEVRYDRGPGGAPKVVIEIYAALSDRKAPEAGVSRLFQSTTPANSNSVHAIAAAFDEGVGKVLTGLIAWVDAKGEA